MSNRSKARESYYRRLYVLFVWRGKWEATGPEYGFHFFDSQQQALAWAALQEAVDFLPARVEPYGVVQIGSNYYQTAYLDLPTVPPSSSPKPEWLK